MSDILKRVGHGTLIACGICDNGVFITMGAFHHLGSFRSIALEQNGVIDTVCGFAEIMISANPHTVSITPFCSRAMDRKLPK